MIRDISDPEHPLSLEQLNIVQVRAAVAVAFSADVLPVAVSKAACPVPTPSPQLSKIWVDDAASRVAVEFVPTIPHCRSRAAPRLPIRTWALILQPPPGYLCRV